MKDLPLDRESRITQLIAEVQTSALAGRPIEIAKLRGLYPDLADQLPQLLAAATLKTTELDSATTGSWSKQTDPMPETLGRYRVIRRIGSGGMGAVYEADDPELSRRVAVKVPYLDRPSERPEVMARFLREARAAAAVQHPNVCPIFDTGEHDGVPFAVMAFIDGGTLADSLPSGEFRDPKLAVSFARQIADGLAAIHSCGIIHRDLKPGNILLDDSGSDKHSIPKITDFGLARGTDGASNLTRSGGLIGTPAYMSPEQAVGDVARIAPATDIYALGVILYQMLAGQPPFEGAPLAILAKVREESPITLSKLRPDLEPRLVKIVERAMAKLPGDRHPSAHDFADDLQRWQESQATIRSNNPKTVHSEKLWSRKRIAVGLLILLATVGGLFLRFKGFFLHFADAINGESIQTEVSDPSQPASLEDVLTNFAVDGPRVQIQWEQNYQGKVINYELPFVIAVLANLNGTLTDNAKASGAGGNYRERRFITVDNKNIANVFRQIAPRLRFNVPDPEDGTKILDIDIDFTQLEDFKPASVVARVPSLKSMLDVRAALTETEQALLDKRLSARLVAVLHNPEFCKLEATWRGISYLSSVANEELQIRVLNVSKIEVIKDLNDAVGFDQSTLYKKIYDEMFDVLGGQPAGLLVGDFEIDISHPDGINFLRNISQIAVAAQCPMLFASAPGSFGLDSWAELHLPQSLSRMLDTTKFRPYREFRETPEAKYTALALPRILVRLPYGNEYSRVNEFRFEETNNSENASVWMNPAWAFAACVGRTMTRHGWPARICGRDGGGRIDGLPASQARSVDGDFVPVGPLDVTITLRREEELSSLGFMTLLPTRDSSTVVFPNAASCAYGVSTDSDARLNVLLCATRFSHALRAKIRDRAEVGIGAQDIERMNTWLAGFVLQEPYGNSAEEQVRRPLSEGHVEGIHDPSKSNSVEIVLTLRPRFQINDLPDSVRITIGRYSWNP